MLATIRRPATSEHVAELVAFVASHAEACGLASKLIPKLELAAEELVTNIVKYAYPPGAGPIEIRIIGNSPEYQFKVAFIDEGPPFNPLTLPKPNVEAALEERSIGGLGIHMVKTMFPGLSYQRTTHENILSLVVAGP